MPQIRIPKEFEHSQRKLVAIPETEYRRLRRAQLQAEEFSEVQQALAEFRAGEGIEANSIDDVIAKVQARS